MSYQSDSKIKQLIEQGYDFDLGSYISQAWNLVKNNLGTFLLFSLVMGGFFLLLIIPYVNIIGMILFFVFYPSIIAGIFRSIRKLDKGEEVTMKDWFINFDLWLPIVGTGLLMGLCVLGGYILLVIPAIYLAYSYALVMPLIVFRGLKFWDAMEASRKIVTKNWFQFFAFVIILQLINYVGILALGVGMMVTIPVILCSYYYCYKEIVGFDADQFFVEEVPLHQEQGDQDNPQAAF